MRVSFVYPTAQSVTGGIAVLYQFANGLARLGHEVNFLHGPNLPGRIESLDELPEMCIGHGVTHHLVDALTDPDLPSGDVIFNQAAPPRLGLPATIVQGHRMLSDEMERVSFVGPGIKICVATWLVDIGLEMGAPRESLIHIPPGLDHDCFRLRRPLQDRPIDVVFMYHAHREKGW
ncbi:MAG: hypothetical protein IH940_03780, partial [Acidobacteria bacterium]|nr:hypothetical protein [Acidobacteriota bacterium]